jgi:hypothetical protein
MSEDRAKRGRRQARDVAGRRRAAQEYLLRYFPRSAAIFDQLRDGQMTTEQLTTAVAQMLQEAQSVSAYEPDGETDATSTNPEQSLARALHHASVNAARLKICHEAIAAVDTLSVALKEEANRLQALALDDQRVMIAAAAQRPTIDREIEARAIDLLRSGANRADLARMKQNAARLWKKPTTWEGLHRAYGPIQFNELSHSGSPISREVLPPSGKIATYLLNPEAVAKQAESLTGNALARLYIEHIQRWIVECHDGPMPREPAALARAWLPLIMRSDERIWSADLWENAQLPSAWTSGKIMQVQRGATPP